MAAKLSVNSPTQPAVGPYLAADEVAAAVTSYMVSSPIPRRWDVETSFDWDTADANRLTDGQRSAVEFVTIIEDHLPGYFALYHRHFPVECGVDRNVFLHNRELYHFTVRWAQEEDSHARALFRYQVASGMASPAELRESLADEAQKEFVLPYEHAVQFFAYALVQEKATQMYYQHLRDVTGDPVLRDVLNRLSRDEARHFTFMANVVERFLVAYGDDVVEPIRDTIAHFRMPLADTMRGYWRWALRIADTAAYDHTEAYDHLIRVINRAVDTKTERQQELIRFLTVLRGTPLRACSQR